MHIGFNAFNVLTKFFQEKKCWECDDFTKNLLSTEKKLEKKIERSIIFTEFSIIFDEKHFSVGYVTRLEYTLKLLHKILPPHHKL